MLKIYPHNPAAYRKPNHDMALALLIIIAMCFFFSIISLIIAIIVLCR